MGRKGEVLGKRLLRSGPHLLVLAAVLAVTRGWWNPYLLCGHDVFHTLQRQVVLHDAIRHGDLWPRYAEAFYFGYGSPLFLFYAPFAHYLTEPFLWAGIPVAVALKLAFAVGLVLSGVLMAIFVRDLFGPWAAAAAGPLYVLAPYHLVDVMFRNAFAEALSFAWLPLALWGMLGAVRDGSAKRMIAGAAGVALLFLTHNITAMIAAPVIGIWWVYLALRYRRQGWRGPVLGVFAGLCGVLLAAFFWVPAALEIDSVWSQKNVADGYFSYWKHFVHVSQFFSPRWHDGASGMVDLTKDMPFQLGLAHWALLAGSIVAFVLRRRWRADLAVFWAFILGALFMCLRRSQGVWAAVPMLTFTQFPWRFLLLAAFAATVAAAATVQLVSEIRWKTLGVAGGLALIVLPFLVYGPPLYSRFTVTPPVKPGRRCVDPAEFQRILKTGKMVRPEELMTIEWIRSHFARASARDDFLPRGVFEAPTAPPPAAVAAVGGEIIKQTAAGVRHYIAQVRMDAPGNVILNRFTFPGWRAWADGREVEIRSYGLQGVMAVPVDVGTHQVEFQFGLTRLRLVAWLLSLGGAFVLAAAAFGARYLSFRPERS